MASQLLLAISQACSKPCRCCQAADVYADTPQLPRLEDFMQIPGTWIADLDTLCSKKLWKSSQVSESTYTTVPSPSSAKVLKLEMPPLYYAVKVKGFLQYALQV